MARTPPAILFRSSVFSKMNAFVPLAGAALVLALATVVPAGEAYAKPSLVVALVLGPVLIAAALIFGRLAVTFDGREIVLAYAFIKKRILLEKVYAVEAHDIKWWHFGGTGIRFTGGGWAWITGSGPGVKIETTRGLTYANCEHPARLAELVAEFKGAASRY